MEKFISKEDYYIRAYLRNFPEHSAFLYTPKGRGHLLIKPPKNSCMTTACEEREGKVMRCGMKYHLIIKVVDDYKQ